MQYDIADLAINQQSNSGDSSNSLNFVDIVAPRFQAQSQSAKGDAQQQRYPGLETWNKQEAPTKPADSDISRAIEALPNHPMKDVVRELANGVLSGKINQQQLAKEMRELVAAVEKNDSSGLPPVDKSENNFGLPALEFQLNKAIEPLNKKLLERGISIYFDAGGRMATITTGYEVYPPTNISVTKTGELEPYQGRHPGWHPNEYRPIPLERAVQILNKRASEYKPKRN